MRSRVGGSSRWQLALDGARQLLASAREGDSVAIVLAGKPARLALAATADLGAAARALSELEPSDRATDLAGALSLARSSLKQLRQVDKRVLFLSDLAAEEIPSGTPAVWAPLSALRQPAPNCAVVSAERRGQNASLQVACNSADAARQRSVELVVAESQNAAGARKAGTPASKIAAGEVLGSVRLAPRAGLQPAAVELHAPKAEGVPQPNLESVALDARITGADSLPEDDRAPVAAQLDALVIAVVGDPATSSVITGGPPILEQALSALSADTQVRPLALIPDDPKQLAEFGAVVVDDPPGLTPEARTALERWLEKGGVALALLGPNSERVQLGASLEPFARGAVRWEATRTTGIDPASLGWLGADTNTLSDLNPTARAALDGAEMPSATTLARWSDGRAWMIQYPRGRGLVLTAGLPASPEISDFSLRPGFLALLDYLLEQTLHRNGPRRSVAGTPWAFPAGAAVEVIGPQGTPLPQRRLQSSAGQKVLSADLAGRYRVRIESDEQERLVTVEPQEIIQGPREPDRSAVSAANAASSPKLDISWQVALIALGFFALELVLRLLMRSGLLRRA
jgi:hypothetical protein